MSRLLELTYTAWDMQPFAHDCGYYGPPFCWDEERRFLLRCELDAAHFHLYGIACGNLDYILETFPIVKRKDVQRHGEYRTKRVILEIYGEMAAAMAGGPPYQTRPPPIHAWRMGCGRVMKGNDMFAKVCFYLSLFVLCFLVLFSPVLAVPFGQTLNSSPDNISSDYGAIVASTTPAPSTTSFKGSEVTMVQLPTSVATPALASPNPQATLLPTAPTTPVSVIYLPAIVFEEVVAPTPTSAPVNLAPNPSFEEGIDSPFGWIPDIEFGGMTFAWDGTIYHSGSRTLNIHNAAPDSCTGNPSPQCASGGWVTLEPIAIDPTHDYLISAWYRNESLSDRVSFLAIMWGDESHALGSTGLWRLSPTNEWTYRSHVIEASILQEVFPGVNRVQLRFGHFSENTDDGGVWIDDVSFVDLTLHPNYPNE